MKKGREINSDLIVEMKYLESSAHLDNDGEVGKNSVFSVFKK